MTQSFLSTDLSVKQLAETMSSTTSQPFKRLSSDCVASEAFGNNKTSMTSQDSSKEKSFATTSTSHNDILTRLAQARADLDKRFQKVSSQGLASTSSKHARKPGSIWKEVAPRSGSIGKKRSQSRSQPRHKGKSAPGRRVTRPTTPVKSIPQEYVFFTTTGGGPTHKSLPQQPSEYSPVARQPRNSYHRDDHSSFIDGAACSTTISVPVESSQKYTFATTSTQYDASSERPKSYLGLSPEYSHFTKIRHGKRSELLSKTHFHDVAGAKAQGPAASSAGSDGPQPNTPRVRPPAKRSKQGHFLYLRSLSCPPRLCDVVHEISQSADPVAGERQLAVIATAPYHGTHRTVKHYPTTDIHDNGYHAIIENRRQNSIACKLFSEIQSAPSSPKFSTQLTNFPVLSETLRSATLPIHFSHKTSHHHDLLSQIDFMAYFPNNGFGSCSDNGFSFANFNSNPNGRCGSDFRSNSNSRFNSRFISQFNNGCGNGLRNISNTFSNGLNAFNPLFNSGFTNGYSNFRTGYYGVNNSYSAGFGNSYDNISTNLINSFNASFSDTNPINANMFDDFLTEFVPQSISEPVADPAGLPQQNDTVLPFKSPQEALQHAYTPQHNGIYYANSQAQPSSFVQPAQIMQVLPLPTADNDDEIQVVKHVILAEPMSRTFSNPSSSPGLTDSIQSTEFSSTSSTPRSPGQVVATPLPTTVTSPKHTHSPAPRYTIKHEMVVGPNTQGFRCTDGEIVAHFEDWVKFEKKRGHLKRNSKITFDCTIYGIAGIGQVKPFWELEARVNKSNTGGEELSLAAQESRVKLEEKRAQRKKYREVAKAKMTEADRQAKAERAKAAREEKRAEKEQLLREAEENMAVEIRREEVEKMDIVVSGEEMEQHGDEDLAALIQDAFDQECEEESQHTGYTDDESEISEAE